jgi:predicted DNA-binding mobile mystery protein A
VKCQPIGIQVSVKGIVREQYAGIVDRAARNARGIELPREGWLRTVRCALGMSVAQLSRRLGVTRANIYKIEKMEMSGNVTIKTMQDLAGAMGCRIVYAIVPETDVDVILASRAKLKAKRIVEHAGKHMALEAQSLSQKQTDSEIERLQQELLKNLSGRLWDDEI